MDTKSLKTIPGTKKHIIQRVTALLLIPLTVWLLYAVIQLSQAKTLVEAAPILRNPIHITALISFIVAALYHAKIGMEVIIEDYVHSHCWKSCLRIMLLCVCFSSLCAGVLTIVYVHIFAHLFLN